MIPVPAGAHVWIAPGKTCARASRVWLCGYRRRLRRDPHCGHLFAFRGKRGDLIKLLWHDGQGMCLFAKRLEKGKFIWPATVGDAVTITPAQLGYLLERIDWRAPQRTWQPQVAG